MVKLERIEKIYETLPKNYNFELAKIIRTIKNTDSKRIGLQFPDGLLKYAFKIAEILKNYCKVIVLGDVVYGACCIDDRNSKKLKCDLLVHFGHSCLIPVYLMDVRVLYVHVDIKFDTDHLIELIKTNFTKQSISIVGTIQFNSAIHKVKNELICKNGIGPCDDINCKCVNVIVPQSKPLSQGEILGCTSPVVSTKTVVYIGDGRFHLESIMFQNKNCDFYQYCPFLKKMTIEVYDHKPIIADGEVYGIIEGGLGRQGNNDVLQRIIDKLKGIKKMYFFSFNEIKPAEIEVFDFIDVFVQTACPRLSLDWGGTFKKPIVSTYGIFGKENMDYYSHEKLKY